MKKYIYLLISAINIGLTALYIAMSPKEIVPVHYNITGEADSFASKWTLLFFSALPVVLGIIYLIRGLCIKNNKNIDSNKKYENKFILAIFLLLIIIVWFVIIICLNDINNVSSFIGPFFCLILGALVVYLSNMFGKLKQNKVLGIKINATLKSEKVWKKTHKLSGYLGVISGIIMIILGIIGTFIGEASFIFFIIGFFILIIMNVIIPIVYAEILYSKEKKLKIEG